MARYLTSVQRRAKLRSRRSYTRGGRAGNLQCNIPSHITGERTVNDAELLDPQHQADLPLDRMLQRRGLSAAQRRALALALGAATIGMATRALPRSRTLPKFRVAKRAPRYPRVVGIPRSRTRPTAGSRRGMKGGAFRFPRFADFPRNRRTNRRRQRFSIHDAAGAFFQPGEEGF